MPLSLPTLLLTLLLAATPAWARPSLQLAGVSVPDHVQVRGMRLSLNGAGLRTLWGFRVYVAALYLPNPVRDAGMVLGQDIPRSMQLTLLRSASTEQNLDALRGGLIDNNPPQVMQAIAPEVAQFLALISQAREVAAGTHLGLDYIPGSGTMVTMDGKVLGTIPGAAFNQALLRIWLGQEPIQLSLKKALLGQVSM